MDLKKNTLISITSIQWQDGEKSETELLTQAEVILNKNSGTIIYEDTEATGFEGSVTTIKVKGNKEASVIRTGSANSFMSLEVGNRHFCQYGTPFGSMQIGIYTNAIENTLNENGRLYLKYTLDVNASYLSDNELIINIKNTDNQKG